MGNRNGVSTLRQELRIAVAPCLVPAKRTGGFLGRCQRNPQGTSTASNFQRSPVIYGQRSRSPCSTLGHGKTVGITGIGTIAHRVIIFRSLKNNFAGRHSFFSFSKGSNSVIVLSRCAGFILRLLLVVRMRFAVTVVVHVVVLVIFPVVVGGLVVVVHVCFHVFDFLVKVGCSGSRIGCGVRVVHFGLVLRRMAES